MPLLTLQKRQVVFLVAWCAYASIYLLRKPLGVIKTDLQHVFRLDETQLGWFDTALLLPYATLQLLFSSYVDVYGPKTILTICLCVSSASMIGFGAFKNYYIFLILLFINGAAQSLTWPSVVKAVGSWYSGQTRNSVMGVFGTSAYVGGTIGAASAVYFQHHYGWENVYFVPSLIVLANAFFVYCYLQIPDDSHLNGAGKQSEKIALTSQSNPEKIKFLELWKIPGVLDIALAMFCLKLVRYCMYMWLPMYLYEKSNYTKYNAGLLSTAFEIGGMMGSVLIGFVVDRYFKGASLVGTTLFAFLSAILLLLFFVTSSMEPLVNTVLLSLSGTFSCGPDSLLGSSIPMELGELSGIEAGASVLGLVNGVGTIGTFLEGPLIGFIIYKWGWNGMAFALVFLSFISTFYCWKATSVYKPIQVQVVVAT